jgi:CBS domain-containing protein
MLLEHIIRIRHVTGRPVLVCEGARLLGVVGDTEIYRAMLGERVALV